MKKLIITLIISLYAFIPVSSAGQEPISNCEGTAIQYASERVYICTGPKAKVYHRSRSCKGLKKCSGSIKAVSVLDAKSMGRRACRICG